MKRGRRPPLGSNYPSDAVIHIPACAVPSGHRRHFVLPSLSHGSELIGGLTAKICRAGFKVAFDRPAVHRDGSPSCLSSASCNQLLIKVAFGNSKTASATVKRPPAFCLLLMALFMSIFLMMSHKSTLEAQFKLLSIQVKKKKRKKEASVLRDNSCILNKTTHICEILMMMIAKSSLPPEDRVDLLTLVLFPTGSL